MGLKVTSILLFSFCFKRTHISHRIFVQNENKKFPLKQVSKQTNQQQQ